MKFNGKKYLASSRRFLKDIQKEAMLTTGDDPDNQTDKMECILLGKTASGKAKILLFGERFWKQEKNKRTIRYVDFSRITKI